MKFISLLIPLLIIPSSGGLSGASVLDAQSAPAESQDLQRHTGVLPLSVALSRVFEKNPELQASELELKAASARLLQAGLRLNPLIEAAAENFAAMGGTGLFRYTESTLQISQRLELGGKRAARINAAAKEIDVASVAREVKKAELIAATAQAFADVLANQERLANQEQLSRLARQSHSIVVERVAAGKVSPVEQIRATVALSSAQLEEEKQQWALVAAKDRLAALWGGTNQDLERVQGQFDIPPAPAGRAETCLENSPELQLATATVNSRGATLELEQAARKPDLTFSAGFRHLNLEDQGAWVAGVSLPIPVFDKRQGAIAEARIRLEKSLSERKALEWRLRAGLAQAGHEHKIAVREVETLTQTALPAAREALSAVEEGYRFGKFDFLNVLDAQRTYAELQRRYIEAVAAGLRAAIEIERLARCGTLDISQGSAGDIKERADEK